MSIRAQHLTIQLSKRVFESDEFGIVRCQDMIHGVEEYNMKPLLIVGVSYEQLPIHYRQYMPVGETVCLEKFLTEFWNFKHVNPARPEHPITGKPDVLIIDHRIETMLDPAFLDWLSLNGIQYDYSNSKSRKFSAVARQHQVYPDVKIEHHSPTENEVGKSERYQLSLENLNLEMKHQQFVCSLITKPLRSLMQSSVWQPNEALETVIAPDLYTETMVDGEVISRHTQNDLHIYNPHWHKSSNEPYFQYGYLVNNFVGDDSMADRDNLNDLTLALTAMEYQWHTFDAGIQLRLKQFKNKGYRHLDVLSQSDYNELLYRTGICEDAHLNDLQKQGKKLDQKIESFVYDISKMAVTDIATLWKTIVPVRAKCFELVPLLMEKKQKYRVFVAQTLAAQYIFVCCCRYKKSAAFDNGMCRGFLNGNISPMNKEGFNQMVLKALSGEAHVFNELNTLKGKKPLYQVA